MLPIGDDNRYRLRTPIITWFLIAANVLVYIFFQGFGTDENIILSYSMIPQEIITGHDYLGPTPVPVYLTILIAMFMHGGFLHIAGNMLFLYVFGDNVEDRLGHGRFILFYLISGIIGSAAHILVSIITGDGLMTPSLGASGAISGVMGAYLMLFPGNRVRVLLFNIIPTTVSAIIVIGFWFIFQLINGFGYLGGVRSDGVAYAAHIGGFAYGFLGVRAMIPPRRRVSYRRYYR